MRDFSLYAIFVCACGALLGQSSRAPAQFEVASVRPAASLPPEPLVGGGRGGGSGGNGCGVQKLTVTGDRVNYACVPLRGLIAYAFGIRQNQIKGPDWMIDKRFDILAKLPPSASEDQVPEMFKTLLADRFKLAVHRESLEQPVSGLVIKGGLKLKEGSPEAEAALAGPKATSADPFCPQQSINCAPQITNLGGVQTRSTPLSPTVRILTNLHMGTVRWTPLGSGNTRVEAPNTTLEGIADAMNATGYDPPVVDMTGIKGRYEVVLEVSANLTDVVNQARALQEQVGGADSIMMMLRTAAEKAWQAAFQRIGLQLELRKGAADVIVVDHLEKTPTEN